MAIIAGLLAALPAHAQPSEPWVIDKVTGIAVPQSIERLAAWNSAIALGRDADAGMAAWLDTITRYRLARAAVPITLEDKAKAFQACSVALGSVLDAVMRQCLARTGYWNFR